MFGLNDKRQIRNGRAVLFVVSDWCKRHGYDKRTARRFARLAIMCIMTESNCWIYANPNVPDSLHLYHEQMGTDHASVGLFQQQVPMWGTAFECMDVTRSTTKFLNSLVTKRQLPPYNGPVLWQRVQAVQVSAYADGSNYKRNAMRSNLFLLRYWNTGTATPRGKRV